ncbi:MAG: hypothetical protein M3Y07_01855 [Acidobacteriota bacterium]|nr:hypothetical protein [Acidobacteriota bacterium]
MAIQRGLRFIYVSACNSENFKQYGADYLWCFYSIGATSKDSELARTATEMGRERARAWRVRHSNLPAHPKPSEVEDFLFGAYAAECLGFPDVLLKRRIEQAAAKFSSRDFLRFDPSREPPPSAKTRSRYDVWDDALIATSTGDSYGVKLGANYRDVLHWLPAMRPYPNPRGRSVGDFYDTLYAITHLIYTLNGYGVYRLQPQWLPEEYAYLRKNLPLAIKLRDPETMGEFLDTLRSFGMTEADPAIRKGLNFLMRTQDPDGSWGDPKDRDVYNRYHATWTAIDGLREYNWHGEGLSFPDLQDLLAR